MKLHIKRITKMLVAVPLVTPWTEQTVLNPHEGRYKTERAPVNENLSQWLLVGCLNTRQQASIRGKAPEAAGACVWATG
jgi:hypothetical protein